MSGKPPLSPIKGLIPKLNPAMVKEFDDTDDATRAALPRPADYL